jgi:hypothetical protein
LKKSTTRSGPIARPSENAIVPPVTENNAHVRPYLNERFGLPRQRPITIISAGMGTHIGSVNANIINAAMPYLVSAQCTTQLYKRLCQCHQAIPLLDARCSMLDSVSVIQQPQLLFRLPFILILPDFTKDIETIIQKVSCYFKYNGKLL